MQRVCAELETMYYFVFIQMEPLGQKISHDFSVANQENQGGYRVIACRFEFPKQTPSFSHRLGHNSVWVYDHFKL